MDTTIAMTEHAIQMAAKKMNTREQICFVIVNALTNISPIPCTSVCLVPMKSVRMASSTTYRAK